MPHKKETLDRVVALLEKDYPPAVFRYLLDTRRFMDTRIAPDVQVFSPNDAQKPICVVEVGYTRPEKLHHYKESGIVDVRWYGRDDGRLYSYGDVQPITHTVKIKYDFKPDPRDIWHSVIVNDEDWTTDCPAASDAIFALREQLEKLDTKNNQHKTKLIDKAVLGNSVLLAHADLLDELDEWKEVRSALLMQNQDDYFDIVHNSGMFQQDVEGEVWSNRRGIIPLVCCNVCGSHDAAFADRFGDYLLNWADQIVGSHYERFLFQSNRQILDLIRGGASVELAESTHRKTALELAAYLANLDTPATPLIFEEAYKAAFGLPWNEAAKVAA